MSWFLSLPCHVHDSFHREFMKCKLVNPKNDDVIFVVVNPFTKNHVGAISFAQCFAASPTTASWINVINDPCLFIESMCDLLHMSHFYLLNSKKNSWNFPNSSKSTPVHLFLHFSVHVLSKLQFYRQSFYRVWKEANPSIQHSTIFKCVSNYSNVWCIYIYFKWMIKDDEEKE